MATYGGVVRRGLPRRVGGVPWPTADAVVPGAAAPSQDPASLVRTPAERVDASTPAADVVPAPVPVVRPLRRGLPRAIGGEPWPVTIAHVPAAEPPVPLEAPLMASAVASTIDVTPSAPPATQTASAAAPRSSPLRRGLPRTVSGEPWPPADAVATPPVPRAPSAAPAVVAQSASVPVPAEALTRIEAPAEPEEPRVSPSSTRAARPDVAAPSPPVPAEPPATLRERIRAAPLTWALSGLLAAAGLLIAALVVVFAVRWLLALGFMQDFLARYPGEYHLPEGTAPGFPAWVQWQHFFNVFLMVLIIRSGLQVRTEKRPSAFWTPRWNRNGKISLALWFHQSLDILWLINGAVFVALLFVTGHWARIVPTSWEVFPNALSAALQYISLNWPTENGWANYNGLQQLAYFTTVFIAAPLAAVTGVRMSGLWPKNAKVLNRLYPVEWARAVHFPVMLYFVLFIITHVALVLATGALRNLNHMYGGTDVVNWTGFWIFLGSLVIIVAGWIAARPLVLAPIAALSGKVTAR